VARLLVVTSDAVAASVLSELGASVEPDLPGIGLNEALSHGAAVAARRWPGGGIAALTADLPALRPAELGAALTAAAATPAAASSFVADAAHVGTTMYAVAPWGEFAPRFEGGSRARHAASGARELALEGVPGLRRDVDTPDDLREAVALGAGERTTALAGELLASAG
jgi:2-phospho-L-lactate guanylyltransferase